MTCIKIENSWDLPRINFNYILYSHIVRSYARIIMIMSISHY